jgi:hypothetical protein
MIIFRGLVSVVKMATVFEECTTEGQRTSVLLLWTKGFNTKDIHKEMFPVYGGKYLSHKSVHNWVQKFSQGRSVVANDGTEVRKWLRQQSKDLLWVSPH